MQLSIIIINYNTFNLTSKCIESVQEKLTGVEYEIILVDNASTECDPTMFTNLFPKIHLVSSPVNTGFAGGNNLGIQYAKGAYILLLNSDTELSNNAPKICLDHLMAHPEAGLVTCQLRYPNGELQYNCRRFRTITWELLEVVPLYLLLPKATRGQLMMHHYFDHQSFATCDWVWGTFMMFRREIIPRLPHKKLSEDFFMFCEDVLWCWEFKQLGYEIHFVPEAKVMHVHKGSTSKEKLKRTRLTSIKNHAKFMKKFYPDFRWYIFAAIYFTKQYSAIWLGAIFR
jgi:GT2 family glycosyltransferase